MDLRAQPGPMASVTCCHPDGQPVAIPNTSATVPPACPVKVTERRTTIDYAQLLQEHRDAHFAQENKIALVCSTATTAPHSTKLSWLRRRTSSSVSNGTTARARQLAEYGSVRACY